ncbi:MAG TPA: holo-ACP synthase [Gemmatimonadaceae bacterium]|nr:holo-ACP synthase [Gemmatimonadaceae bacterium]
MIVGLGIDLVEIDRVQHMIESLGDRMYARLFSESEARYIRGKPLPAQHAAVRLAAKEAAFKALAGNDLARQISWRDVEVVSDSHGIPSIKLHGAAHRRARELGVKRVHVSLTHTRDTAGAVVVLSSD